MSERDVPPAAPASGGETTPPEDLPADPNATLNLQQTPISRSAPTGEVTFRIPSLKTTVVAPDQTGPRLAMKEVLAEGGFGEVWVASQNSLRRTVAVKRTRQTLAARFGENRELMEDLEGGLVQEALLLATLDHPNIPPIYDLVFEPDGTPKLAMKLVRGRPWKRILDEDRTKLPSEEFLARHIPVLVLVAQAVAFAHSRGILHRDIKPAQVMIAEFGQVYLTDWGLAMVFDENRALAAGIEAVWSLPTRKTASSPGGTVAYMAPEQTRSSSEGLGPLTDVFLLGGTLYYILTGHGPYEKERDAKSAFRRTVAGEIIHASERSPGAPRELVRLCHEALEPSLARRLASVPAFIEGLQAYLSGATRRNDARALVERAKSVLETAVTYREFTEVLEWLEKARSLSPETPECGETAERALGGYSRQALRQGDLKLARVQAERMPEGPYREAVLLDIAEKERSQLLHQRQRRAALFLCAILGILIATLGYFYTVRVNAERQRAETARNQADTLIHYMLGDLYEQLEPLGQTRILKKAGDKALEYFDGLPGGDLMPQDRLRRASVLHQVGKVHEATGDSVAAISAMSESVSALDPLLEISETRLEARRTQIAVLTSLANVFRRRGRGDEALGCLKRLEELLLRARTDEPGNQELKAMAATAAIGSSRLLQARDELDQARIKAEAALALRQELWKANPKDAKAGRDVSISHNELGRIFRRLGRLEEAEDQLSRALEVVTVLAAKEPENQVWKRGLGICHDDLATALILRGKLDEARRNCEQFLELARQLRSRDPENTEWLSNEGLSHRSLGELELSSGNLAAAQRAFAVFGERARFLSGKDPANAMWALAFAGSVLFRAEVLLGLGRASDAAAAAREARAFITNWPGGELDQRSRYLGWSALLEGEALVRQGRGNQAGALLREADQWLESAEKTEFITQTLRLRSCLAQGKRDEARRLARRLLDAGFREARFLRLVASEFPELLSAKGIPGPEAPLRGADRQERGPGRG
ncbi:MAG: serine/threonine-protein kinase [Thermoanaerobaculia bacterium]|nr:serine/threonine-protein kinase [Thermoanaerobaculia bacterium]